MIEVSRGTQSMQVALEAYKEKAFARVAEVHILQRSQFLTDLPGQDNLYMRKEAEARRYLDEPPTVLDPSKYPLIYNEALYTNRSYGAVAQEYVDRAKAWEDFLGPLEGIRQKAKAAIRAAASIADVDAAMTQFDQDMAARA